MAERQGLATFDEKVSYLPLEVFRTEEGTSLRALLWTMLEDPGIGGLAKTQEAGRVAQESIGGTAFSDLDAMFGNVIGLYRTPSEQYPYDPFRDQLTVDQWSEVVSKDASYRERIAMLMAALTLGPSPGGIALMAEAVCGWPCEVVELWRYTTNLGVAAIGRLNAAREFVVVPLTDQLTMSDYRAMYRMIRRFKPVNTVVTVDETSYARRLPVAIAHASAPSFHSIIRYVSAGSPAPVAGKSWVSPSYEVEAPTFAYLEPQTPQWSLNDGMTVTAWTSDGSYAYPVGSVAANAGIGATTLTVKEITPMPPGGFSIKIGSEIVAVKSRAPGSAGQWVYTLAAVTTAAHNANDVIFAAYQPLQTVETNISTWSAWMAIDQADAPDNFPNGKYPGDPTRYGPDGQYVFEWSSQQEYVAWLTDYVSGLGGQMGDQGWRLPVASASSFGGKEDPRNALAATTPEVRSPWFPGAISSRTEVESGTTTEPAVLASQQTGYGGGTRPGAAAPAIGGES